IADGLKKYMNGPQVTVSVSEINSRRIYVTGEVTRAGAFPLLPNMTVLQALSSSGGFTQFAKLKNIYVLRIEDGKQVKLPFNDQPECGHPPVDWRAESYAGYPRNSSQLLVARLPVRKYRPVKRAEPSNFFGLEYDQSCHRKLKSAGSLEPGTARRELFWRRKLFLGQRTRQFPFSAV